MKINALIQITGLLLLAGGLNLRAASGSWTGATDNTWAGLNWSASPVPGAGDTASFNGLGNGNTTIDLGSGVTIMNLLFNTGSAAAYTIGNGAVGSQTLTLNNSGGITLNSKVASNQLFNAAIVLGTDSTAQSYTNLNNSAQTLTFASSIYGGPSAGSGTAGTKTLVMGGSGNTVISGSLLNGATSGATTTTVALTKLGAGTLTFNGSVNASTLGGGAGGGAFGTVTDNAGTLAIDFSNAGANSDLLNSYSPVSLGGGTLQVIGNASNASTQNFNNGSGVTANPGFNVITIGPNGGNMSDPLPTLNLGAFPQTLGSQTMFVGPSYNANYSGGTATNLAATGTITTTTLGLQNNLLWPSSRVAVATVGLYEWASVITTPAGTQSILAGSQQTGTFYTTVASGGTVANADANYDLLGNATFNNSKPAYVDTLRFNVPGAFTATTGAGGSGYLLLIGGILVTPNVGPNNTTLASGGEWIAGANTANNSTCALDVYQNNTAGELFINVPIYFWSSSTRATSYVKGGAGTVDLTGSGSSSANTGAPYLNGGCTVVNNNSQIGATASAKTLSLNGGTLVASANTSLDNGGGGNVRPVMLLGNGGGLAAETGFTLTVDGQVGSGANTGPLVIGIPASTANGNVAGLLPGTGSGTANTTPVYGTGTVKLNNTTGNFYFGGVNIVGGATLNINGIYALGGANYLGGVTFNNGSLQYAAGTLLGGSDITLGGTGGVVPQTVSLVGNATIDVDGQTVTYAGSIGNAGGGQLTVANSGSGGGLFLNGGSTHTGGTVVATNGILGGNGTISGNVTVNSGGMTQPSSGVGATNTITGSLTYTLGSPTNSANFNLSSSANGGPNDQIVLSGNSQTLTCGSVKVGIKCGPTLDLANDYVLFKMTGSSPTISGSFNATPVWLATPPSGAGSYQVIKSGNNVLLHYAGSTPPNISASSATPSTAVRNQNNVAISVTVAGAGASTITGVSVNLSAIGGTSASLSLTSGTSANGTWTGTITVPAASGLGTVNLAATATDNNGATAAANISLTVNASTETWSGLGGGNWSDNADWVSAFAPGLVGDTLIFDGSTGVMTPNMDNNYSVTGVTFPNTAGSFTIGTSSSTLTITGGGVMNNSTNAETLNVPVSLTTAAQSLNAMAGNLTLGSTVNNNGNLLTVADGGFNTTISGAISGNGGLTKAGAGTLALGGANSYVGSTLVSGGGLTLNSGGTVNYASGDPATVIINNTGTMTVNTGATVTSGTTATSQVIVGNTSGNAVLNVAGGTVNANATAILPVGNVSGANGFVFMNAGNLNVAASELHIGNVAGSYGAFDVSGSGALTVPANSPDGYMAVGVAGLGVLNMTSGMISNNAAYPSIGNQAGGTGVVNISGGLLVDNKGIHVGDRSTGILNVSGSANINLTGGPLQFGLNGQISTGTANLLGGTVTANNVGAAATSTSRLNFNGGTLQAGTTTATFLQGLTAATIYSGGAILDDGGNTITIAQPLLAPAGNGVSAIPVATAGAGYLDTPIVSITGGGGVGASAVANVSSGVVTGITVVNPGTGYTSAPTVTLSGGGYSSAATLGTATIAANTSGGLAKQGAGTLILTGANTYTNLTTVNAGTLALQSASSATAGYVVTNGATLDVSAISPPTLSAGQSLSGGGTINGSLTTSSGVNIYPANALPKVGTVNTLTFNNDLDLSGGGSCYFDIATTATSGNDQIVVGGTLTINGGVLHLKALSGAANLDATADYVLFSNANSPNITTLPAIIWDGTTPANAANYSLQLSGNNLVLHYITLSGPLVTAVTVSPGSAIRGQNVQITATVTPGNGAINPSTGVTVDLSALGGSATSSMVLSNANVYTNTFTVLTSTAPGSQLLTVTATDANSLSGSGGASLTINASTEVWNGGDYSSSVNWNDGSNWVSTFPPGLVGDALVFAGTTGPSPSMENNYSVTSVTFANGAGSFNIGTPSSTLTITAGGVTNNSANVQNLNVPVNLTTVAQSLNAAAGDLILGQNLDNGGNLLTVTDGGHNTTLNGVVSGNGGLTKIGNGILTLGGANNYSGASTVNSGTVTVNNNGVINETTSQVIVGNVAGNAILNINGGIVNANAALNPALAIGNVTNANGFLFMSSGNLDCGAGEFHIGQAAGAYGAFDLSGGTVTLGDVNAADAYFVVGGAFGNSASKGVFNMSGGTLNDSAQPISIANIVGAIGVANISGGSINDNKGIHVGDRGTAILNVSGSAAVNLSGGPLQFGLNGNTTFGTVNLLGGLVTANNVGVAGTSTSQLNFNGGTLQAAATTATFMQGLTAATIYSGGALIDDGGNTITIAQPLLAPTGNGVSTIPVATAGVGYLDTPIVTISGGGGTGATAAANISGGSVTGVTITSPGIGYTSAPTVTLFGGGYSTAATLGTATIAANVSGGLTKQNTGTLTLSGANTYTGNTTINGGTLEIVQATIATNSTVTVTNGAVLQLDFAVTNIVAGFVTNGVSAGPGVYNNTTSSPYITGSGSLQVVLPVIVNTNPTNITAIVTGSTLSLNWPSDHLGWTLQTNSVDLANTNYWFPYPGSASVTTVNITINPAQTNVFFRLVYP